MSICTQENLDVIRPQIEMAAMFGITDINTIESNISKILRNFTFQKYINDANIVNLIKEFNLLTEEQLTEMINSAPEVTTNTNVVPEISNYEISELFKGMPVASALFEKRLKDIIATRILIGQDKSNTYNGDNESISKNLHSLKNDIFRELQQFLVDRNIINGVMDLYDVGDVVIDHDYYSRIMNHVYEYFFTSGAVDTYIFNGKSIPNLNIDITKNEELFNAYNNLILLNNFDSVMISELGGILSVDFAHFNDLGSIYLNEPKYKLQIDPRSTLYWSQDDHSSESSEGKETDLSKIIIESIPAYNKHNQRMPGEYIEMKDIYLFGAMISSFELRFGNELKNNSEFKYFAENENEVLDYYIDALTEKDLSMYSIMRRSLDVKHNPHGTSLYEIRNIAHSLKNFLDDPNLNIRVKEKTSKTSVVSLITQAIKNNYGAIYSFYDTEAGYEMKTMYQQNWNNISVNNALIGNIKAVNGNLDFFDENSEQFKKLFEKADIRDEAGMLSEAGVDIEDFFTRNPDFIHDYTQYISEKTGIPLNAPSLRYAIQDFKKHTNLSVHETFSVRTLRARTRDLLDSITLDIKGNKFQDYLKDKLFDGTSTLLHNTGSDPFYLALRNAYLENYVMKSIMNIDTALGNKIPSYKSANLTFKDAEIFNLQRLNQNNFRNKFNENSGSQVDNYYESLLLQNNPLILGTSAKLEGSRQNKSTYENEAKDAVNFTPIESFVSDFNYDFIESILKNQTFQVVLGNYSDKKSIYTKIINGNFKPIINGIESEKSLLEMTVSEILDLFRTQTRNYHENAAAKVFRDYKEILKAIGDDIHETINLSGSFEDNFENNVKAINEILRTRSISSINSQYADLPNFDHHGEKISLTADLHYTKYGKGGSVVGLNQILLDNYRIFNNESYFNKFVQAEEESFMAKYQKHNTSDKVFNFSQADISRALKISNSHQNLSDANGLNDVLRKWMWLNALVRSEYTYSTAKGEYMHPHKNGTTQRDFSEGLTDKYLDDFRFEKTGRLENMAKRNVIFTASIQPGARNSKFVEPKKVNVAAIEDYTDSVNTTSGHVKGNQEVHDGSSFIDDTYSRAVDASQPGAGYKGTKKRFGTLITDFGVTIKKDAETQITNDRIRQSLNSSISLLSKKRQMLSIPFKNGDVEREFMYSYAGRDIKFIRDGETFELYNVYVQPRTDNQLDIKIHVNDTNGKTREEIRTVSTLYGIWDFVGGIYTTDSEGNFTEASNDILQDIITDSPKLFDRMIHILSNTSSLKAGASAVNSASRWTSNDNLLYTTYENVFIGNQLDANQDADQSEIKEVTQMMSAIAQNGFTSEWAREVYSDLERIIEEAAKPYIHNLNRSEEGLYKYMAEKFVDAINRTGSDGLASSVINSLKEDGVNIPFSNVAFYNQFVRNVVTNLNDEFISRHYSGVGSVLIPSHGIIELYEVHSPNGLIVATQEDILKLALQQGEGSNTERLQQFLDTSELFREIILDRNADNTFYFEVGDHIVEVDDDGNHIGDVINIKSPQDYYKYREKFRQLPEGSKLAKVLNRTRDLKSTMHKFTLADGSSKNVYDFKSLELLYSVDQLGKHKPNTSNENITMLENLSKKINEYNRKNEVNLKLSDVLRKYLQVEFALLHDNKVTNDIFSLDLEYLDRPLSNIINNINPDSISNVSDIEFKAAEKIISDIYKTAFDRSDNSSMFEINMDSKKYFKDILTGHFNEDNAEADLKLLSSRAENPIYVRYVSEFSNQASNLNIRSETDVRGETKRIRYNNRGQKVYTLDNNFRVVTDTKGRDVIEIKAIHTNSDGEVIIDSKLENKLSRLVKSFGTSLKAIIPLNNYSNFDEVSKNLFIQHNKNIKTIDSNNWLEDNKEAIIDQLASKMSAGWQLSHNFIDARIPGQSMQSFMPMKNVAYLKGNTNDTYVSVNQIFMQGSDFDIDKAYTLGYSVNNQGLVDIWTNVSSYSDVNQLKALMNLPIPNGVVSNFNENGVDITKELLEFTNHYENLSDPQEFDVPTINAFDRLLRKIGKSETYKFDVINPSAFNEVLGLVNQHNAYRGYLDNNFTFKNSIVANINNIISSPINQILANTPVDVKDLHDAIDENNRIKGRGKYQNYVLDPNTFNTGKGNVKKGFVDLSEKSPITQETIHTEYLENSEYKDFSNPFVSNDYLEIIQDEKSKRKVYLVKDKKAEINSYVDWILNNPLNIQTSRRNWILEQLIRGDLKGKTILESSSDSNYETSNALDYLINRFDWTTYTDPSLKSVANLTAYNNIPVERNDSLDKSVVEVRDGKKVVKYEVNRIRISEEFEKHNIKPKDLLDINDVKKYRPSIKSGARINNSAFDADRLKTSDAIIISTEEDFQTSGTHVGTTFINSMHEAFNNPFYDRNNEEQSIVDYINWIAYDPVSKDMGHYYHLSNSVKKKLKNYTLETKRRKIRNMIISQKAQGIVVAFPNNYFNRDKMNHAKALSFLINSSESPFRDYLISNQRNKNIRYYEGDITPDNKTIFVFGSNPEGRHRAGSAKEALFKFGAIYGQGEGLQGNAYALPTKDLSKAKDLKQYSEAQIEQMMEKTIIPFYEKIDGDFLQLFENNPIERSISINDMVGNIKKLYAIAEANPDKDFSIAYRGSAWDYGLNGYLYGEMMVMFNAAGEIPSNIIFSKEWYDSGILNLEPYGNHEEVYEESEISPEELLNEWFNKKGSGTKIYTYTRPNRDIKIRKFKNLIDFEKFSIERVRQASVNPQKEGESNNDYLLRINELAYKNYTKVDSGVQTENAYSSDYVEEKLGENETNLALRADPDKSWYEATKTFDDVKKGDIFTRVSNFLHEKPTDTGYLKQALSIGNSVDRLLRLVTLEYKKGNYNFKYNPNEFSELSQLSPDVVINFINQYMIFLNEITDRGERILTGNGDLGEVRLYNNEGPKIAGTVDLMTVDSNGKYRIYDYKTMRSNAFGEKSFYFTKFKDQQFTTYDKHRRQQNAYALMLANTYGVDINNIEVNIIPIKVFYPEYKYLKDKENFYTSELTFLKDVDGFTPEIKGSLGKAEFDETGFFFNIPKNNIKTTLRRYSGGEGNMPDLKLQGVEASSKFKSESTHTVIGGGAYGADSHFPSIGSLFTNIKSKQYYIGEKTPTGNYDLREDGNIKYFVDKADKMVSKANETLQRNISELNDYTRNLLRRNAAQVLNSNGMYAIASFNKDGAVDDTAWAVQMAIDRGKEDYDIYVFDQNTSKWYLYNYGISKFEEFNSTPVLTTRFAGIGSRKIELNGLNAIRDLYVNTFGELEGTYDVDGIFEEILESVTVAKTDVRRNPLDLLSNNDMFSYYEQQYNAAVGRDNVGTSANGLKAFYALSDYYNTYFNDYDKALKSGDASKFQDLEKTKLFNFEFTWYNQDGPKHHVVNTIADVQIKSAVLSALQDRDGGFTMKHSNAAKFLSDLLSAATDNAKELIMAKINATPELVSMPIFMYILGFDNKTIVDIMTSDIMSRIVDMTNSNIFKSGKSDIKIWKVFDNLKKVYTSEQDSENLKTIIKIHQGSKELGNLAQLLGVNQSRKANTDELYKYFNGYKSAIINAGRKYEGYKKRDTFMMDTFIDSILDRNPNHIYSRDEIVNIVNKAFDLDIIHNYDFERHFTDENYRKIATDYLDVVKSTINVFDVMDSIPHYKGMVKGLFTTHTILKKLSAKYRFIFDEFRKTTEIENPTDKDIRRAQLYFDTKVIQNWTRHSNKAKSIQLDVKQLMRLSGIKSFKYYTSNEAKNNKLTEGNMEEITLNSPKNKIITLNSDYEIANFKLAVEGLIYPILHKRLGSDNFFRMNTINDKFNMKMPALASSVPLRNSKTPVLIEKFSRALNTFNNIDQKFDVKTNIKNINGEYITWKDLLFTYNLIVNNEKHGDNRLTALFQDYMNDNHGFGYDYIKFYENIDSGLMKVSDSPNYESDLNFYVNNKQGVYHDYVSDNSDFVISLDVSNETEGFVNIDKDVNDVLKLIRDNSLSIILEC